MKNITKVQGAFMSFFFFLYKNLKLGFSNSKIKYCCGCLIDPVVSMLHRMGK